MCYICTSILTGLVCGALKIIYLLTYVNLMYLNSYCGHLSKERLYEHYHLSSKMFAHK